MSRLHPAQKALIRAAVKEYDKGTAGKALACIFVPFLIPFMGGHEKQVAEKMDLGPRSTRVFIRVLKMRHAARQVKRAA